MEKDLLCWDCEAFFSIDEFSLITTTCLKCEEKLTKEYLLVLDLDGTLINSYYNNSFGNNDYFFSQGLYTYKRPYLDNFLWWASKKFRIGIWTASSKSYALPIVKKIFSDAKVDFNSIEIFFTSKETKWKKEYMGYSSESKPIKDLNKIVKKLNNITLNKILIVDDIEHNALYNYNNLIHIPEYERFSNDNEEDNYLLKLQKYLDLLLKEKDIININKKDWHKK